MSGELIKGRVEAYRQKPPARVAHWYGVPVTDLNCEELLAFIADIDKWQMEQRRQNERDIRFFADLNRMKRLVDWR